MHSALTIRLPRDSPTHSIILPHLVPLIRLPPRLKILTPLSISPPYIRKYLPRPLVVLRYRTSQPSLRWRARERERAATTGIGAVTVIVVGKPARVGDVGEVSFVGFGEGEGAVFGDVDGLSGWDVGVLYVLWEVSKWGIIRLVLA